MKYKEKAPINTFHPNTNVLHLLINSYWLEIVCLILHRGKIFFFGHRADWSDWFNHPY